MTLQETQREAGYTPTTEEVREAVAEWMWSRRMFRPDLTTSDGKELDRFLKALPWTAIGEATP